MRHTWLGAALALFGAACADRSDVSSDDSDLIGGRATALAELPSTIHLADGCTAAKVAPKLLLTAAHCVLNLSTLEPKYGPVRSGSPRAVKLSRDPAGGYAEHEVAAVHVHPKWMSACARTLCSISAVTAKLDAPDVALLELGVDLAEVPIAPVESRPLAAGDEVVVVGFGCTDGVHVAGGGVRSLASATATVVAASAAVHDGSPVSASDEPIYAGNYAFTAGPGAGSAHAGLCPGDSGGPLYRRRGNELVVAGVNANYTLRSDEEDAVGLPVTNWHTRLDDGSRNNVYAWIESVRVAVQTPRL
jgi:hypothetical protein